ncbi:hypothetical protein ZWY2020_012823 [Hordeum vulgare]|nr:hypothetical protein ZWY2020_012823 [Hordeum vulgare]
MPATTASGQWAELPADLLRDIACRLHIASDSVRFDAVCRPWRNALEDQELFLPWLLAPSEAGDGSPEDQRCRCVFSRTSYRAPGICTRDRRVACADGTAGWLLSAHKELSLVDPLNADPLSLPFPSPRLDRKDRFRASILRPGDGEGQWQRVSSDLGGTGTGTGTDRFCAAAHYRGYVVCVGLATYHVLRPNGEPLVDGLALPVVRGKARRCSHLVEYDGRLLLASVLQVDGGNADDLSVSLHKLRVKKGGEVVRWRRRDFYCDEDDVLFLGFPGSFAVDVESFGGEVSGGTAYFVMPNAAPRQPCSVYRYNFKGDGAATLVETLPSGWNDASCMWFIPAPDIRASSTRVQKLLRTLKDWFFERRTAPTEAVKHCVR